MARRPHILYAEQQYAPNTRAMLQVQTELQAPRDMDIEAVWFGAYDVAGRTEQLVPLLINPKFTTRNFVSRENPAPVRFFDSYGTDRQPKLAERGWRWDLRYPYPLDKDDGFVVTARNAIPVAGGTNADLFDFAAHVRSRNLDPQIQRLLWIEANLGRAAAAPVPLGSLIRTNRLEGDDQYEVSSLEFVRGATAFNVVPGAESLGWPAMFYVRVAPPGREPWSERDVPLPAYGLSAGPDGGDQSGVFWRPTTSPGKPCVLPQSQSLELDVQNRSGALTILVMCAVIGWVEEEGK